jgi:hypothetical protein
MVTDGPTREHRADEPRAGAAGAAPRRLRFTRRRRASVKADFHCVTGWTDELVPGYWEQRGYPQDAPVDGA